MPLVKWQRLTKTECTKRWGIKHLNHFSKAMAINGVWRMMATKGPWQHVMKAKYISLLNIPYWIEAPNKEMKWGIHHKAMVGAYKIIGENLT
jgi:hypothetical protein